MIKAYKLLSYENRDVDDIKKVCNFYEIGSTYYSDPLHKRVPDSGFYGCTNLFSLFGDRSTEKSPFHYKIFEVELNGETFSYDDGTQDIWAESITFIREIPYEEILKEIFDHFSNPDRFNIMVSLLLKDHPYLIECPYISDRATGTHISISLRKDPSLFQKMNISFLERMDSNDLMKLILEENLTNIFHHEQSIKDLCRKKLKGQHISLVLQKYPDRYLGFDLKKMKSIHLSDLLRIQPQLMLRVPYKKIKKNPLVELLMVYPNLLKKISNKRIKELSGQEISRLLNKYPEMVEEKNFPLGKLNSDDLYFVLKGSPNLHKLFELSILYNDQVSWLLVHHYNLFDALKDRISSMNYNQISYIKRKYPWMIKKGEQ